MKYGKIKLEEKFIILIFLVGIFCFGLLGFLSYKQIGQLMISQNKQDAMSIAKIAASEIDGDAFAQITSTEDDAYQQIYHELSNYRSNNLITYIYAMKEEGDSLVFVVDTDPEEPAGFLEPYQYLDEMRPAFDGEVCCDKEITSDRWGQFYSTYAPIFDSNGRVVGIVGCDTDLETVNDSLGDLKNMIVVLTSFFAVIVFCSAFFVFRQMINRDPQTEIANYERLQTIGRKLEKNHKLSCYCGIMFQVKDQKFLTQKIGDASLDDLMRAYGKNLNKRIKKHDYVFSLGNGNFFALIRKEREQLYLDAIMHKELPLRDKNAQISIPINVLCGVFRIREHDTINEVVNYCTLAQDSAREQGESDIMWFCEDMIESMMNEKEIIDAFKTGLDRHEFAVFYQPKVNIDNNTLCGAEALVRWYRNGKIVPPDSFIPILEKNNLITELDFYVFEQVCRDIKRWEEQGLKLVRISSNFSKLHLKNDYFAEDLVDILEKYKVDASYIEAELTESSGFYDLKALKMFVYKMNDAHISVSIDDFGTGYSSLALLKDLEFDVVKMDKTFFRDIEKGDAVNDKMVENLIRMVKDLNREIISEGIETEKQAEFLRNLRAPIVQGYLYDKPLPHYEFEDRLRNPVYKNISIIY